MKSKKRSRSRWERRKKKLYEVVRKEKREIGHGSRQKREREKKKKRRIIIESYTDDARVSHKKYTGIYEVRKSER